MTIHDIVAHSGLASLDAEVLLAYVLGKDRTWVVAHGDSPVLDAQHHAFDGLARRRRAGEPSAYITGTKEFFGRPFTVTKATLIPRPSTEGLVEATLEFLENRKPITREVDTGISVVCIPLRDGKHSAIVDIGTGSGIIAATLVQEGRKENIIAVDISAAALDVAKKNFGELTITSVLSDGSDFVRSMKEPFIVVSNPPYIPEGTTLERDVVDFEPKEALFAGKDGLDVLRKLMDAARGNAQCLGVCLELRTDQIPAILHA